MTRTIAFYCARCRRLLRFPASCGDALVYCPFCRQKAIVPTPVANGASVSSPASSPASSSAETERFASTLTSPPTLIQPPTPISLERERDERSGAVEREPGPLVVSYLTPKRDRFKTARRLRVVGESSSGASKIDEIKIGASESDGAFGAREVAAVETPNGAETPLSDDEFLRRLVAEKSAADGENRRRATAPVPTSSRAAAVERKSAARKAFPPIAAVAIVVLALTFLVVARRRSTAFDGKNDRDARPVAAASAPIFLDGALTYRTPSGRLEGDEGAFVFLFPTSGDFGDSLTLGDVAPGRKLPPRFDEFVAKLEARGGYFAIAEFDGRFSVSLKSPGEFDALLVSRNVADSPDAEDAAAIREISRYLHLPEQKLLAKRRFLWFRRYFDGRSAVVEENFGKARADSDFP